MPRSLSLRFFLASIVLLPILLGISAYSLDVAMRRSLMSGEQEALKTQVYLLLGVAELTDNQFWMPEQFQEPRYNQIDSGLYGIALNNDKKELWRSPSAQLLNLPTGYLVPNSISPGNTSFSTIETGRGQLFLFSYDIVWESGENGDSFFRLIILHQQDQYLAELSGYRNQLWRWLGLLTVFIIATQTIILRWGLRPLGNLAKDLQQIKSGKAEQLTGDYPTEIQLVTDNLNQVLSSEREQRDRYRTTLDDLAHSLKTPLSVIQSSAQNESANTAGIISDQVERMNQIVEHQLKRAVIGNIGVTRSSIDVKTVVSRLTDSLQKVYATKNITASLSIEHDCRFFGDERDLFELLGNLIENAFKYGTTQVAITASNTASNLLIIISDDGPGVAESQRQTILERGARADTATSGQGIGLAVAVDIISSYKGSLEIDQSEFGGARFKVSLPQQI